MKKFMLMALTALFAVSAVQAQKVNKAAFESKIEKSNADIADAKKNTKAATWYNRGKFFYEVLVEPTKSLFGEMDVTMLKLAMGDPASMATAVMDGASVPTMVYPYVTVYEKDGKVVAWLQTQEIAPNALKLSAEAYLKALELDPKMAEKVKEGLKQLSDFCAQKGDVALKVGEYKQAADAFAAAYDMQSNAVYGETNPALLYYAGYLETVVGANDSAAYVRGEDYLNKALALGYADEEGMIYYYLFHCYYGQRENDAAFIVKAKNALLKGVEKFPKNERMLDGLMQLYTSEEGIGNPADLITMIDAAIANNPENLDLWFGRGRIFNALKNFDESIASFRKVTELKPELYEGQYYTGAFYALKGDAMNTEMNQKQYSSQAAYDADLKTVNQVYLEAIPWLEKAYELKPDDIAALDLLKSICFRLRDEAGMADKYTKYNELYKQMKGE